MSDKEKKENRKENVPEILLHNTVRVVTKVGKEQNVGTAFGVSFRSSVREDASIPCLITNRHLVEGASKGNLHFSVVNEDGSGPLYGRVEVLELDDFDSGWIFHPDKKVDLAMAYFVPINDIYSNGLPQ